MNNQYQSSPINPADTSQYQSQMEVRPKAPVILIVITWIMLLGGIGRLLILVPLLTGGLEGSLLFPQIMEATMINIGLVIASFGLRRMRRWSLYLFSALVVLAIIGSVYALATPLDRGIREFGDDFVLVLLLIYFWAISKRFT